MKKQKIVFFGSGGYTIPIIEKLKTHGLKFVLTTESEGTLVSYLKSNKIPFKTSHLKDTDSTKQIQKLKSTLGVLASYGAIVPEKVINLFPMGILNIHPSLLPKYKGPSPIQAAILSGENETGVTIIKLDNQVDHGSIVSQSKTALNGTETTQDLKQTLFAKGAEMVEKILKELEAGEPLITYAQNHSQETFTKKIERADGETSLDNVPNIEQLDRMIRAYYPWPGVWFRYYSGVIATRLPARQGSEATKQSRLDGKVIKLLPEKKIQVEGKKPMSYKGFINGYQQEGKNLLEKLNLL